MWKLCKDFLQRAPVQFFPPSHVAAAVAAAA